MRLSIPAKVFSGFAAVLVTFALVTLFGAVRLHRTGEGLSLVSQVYHPLTRMGAQLESSYRNSEQATARLGSESDPYTQRALLFLALDYHPRAAREKLDAARQRIEEARAAGPRRHEGPFLDRLEGLLEAVQLRYGEYARAGAEVESLLGRLERSGSENGLKAELDAALRRLKTVERRIGVGLTDFLSELDQQIDLRVREAGREERESALLIAAFTLLAVGIGIVVTVHSQRLLAPIRQLTAAVKEVGEGRFAGQIPVTSDDELGLLAREFNAMSSKLAEREKQLSEKTEALLRSERLAAVGRLAAQITHEIRNPLSSLSLNAELLQEQLGGSDPDTPEAREEARALVAAMSREVDRLTDVTEEYLRFARMPKPAFASVDLDDAVEELLEFTTPELASAGVSLDRGLDAQGACVRADPGQLRQILFNLVRNAREAVGQGGRVRVTTEAHPELNLARVEIEDDGPGIEENVRERIFEPFFSTKEKGTGLGLALVQQIVLEHGGEMSCDSAPGRGTRMSVSLPLAEASAASLSRAG